MQVLSARDRELGTIIAPMVGLGLALMYAAGALTVTCLVRGSAVGLAIIGAIAVLGHGVDVVRGWHLHERPRARSGEI